MFLSLYKSGRIWVTQMEAVHARQMFPCLDEPRYKATFQLHVARTENFTALSNTPKV